MLTFKLMQTNGVKLKKLTTNVPIGFSNVVDKISSQIDSYVPANSGALRHSKTVTKAQNKATISWQSSYARYVYFGNGKYSRWCDKATGQNKQSWKNRLLKEATK